MTNTTSLKIIQTVSHPKMVKEYTHSRRAMKGIHMTDMPISTTIMMYVHHGQVCFTALPVAASQACIISIKLSISPIKLCVYLIINIPKEHLE